MLNIKIRYYYVINKILNKSKLKFHPNTYVMCVKICVCSFEASTINFLINFGLIYNIFISIRNITII